MNFVKLFINGIPSFIFFLTKYNLVISDANPCVYHSNECIELSLGFLLMMELHVPLMNPSSWTCCAIYVDILRQKHIELQYNFILEQYAAKEVDLVYIAYADQSTDTLIKALIIGKTQHFHKLMGLVSQSYVRFNVEI
ncbi:unnamed protein product [Sphagnum balticum]